MSDTPIDDPDSIDYPAVFQALPGMVALLTPDLVYADVNEEFLRMAGRRREEVVGRYLFDVFPDNPNDTASTGMLNLAASLHRVLETGERDSMALQRYDVEVPGRPGVWEERYWSPCNAPVLGADGKVELLVHRVEEVTELIRARGGQGGDRARVLEAELYTRARELQALNERLRQAHARDSEVALALQDAMLPTARQSLHHQVAVRYRPAVGALNVCGDWYDLVDLVGGHRVGVSVGDVVGHGLPAAGVMGQLRSALSAASRVAEGPAQALDVLGRYAHVVDGAESATAVTTFIDFDHRTITYSSAGHPPPMLVHADGRVECLDKATDPPLDARPDPMPRPQAQTAFTGGATLALYTDGLVERRREDIDTGLTRLADSLVRHREDDPETLADAVLLELLPPGGATDDTALVILRL
ncbi:serine phosphatase RsbU (regulator of sigma subunit) [Streptomyces sp. SAI-135]|uniref:PP2C family protein-serine/threonine phosphatase n=1 Tax=unclassified Streptomyces TaxID=2593676 RepID=UPI002473DF9B|nr:MULTISPECIES: SpoIIE family protein phosphatase [unclassified Streptomyces]MDH6520687.1 serine phosphatase RsbU (regulator of sigma subunit) [Streptomyces sp. SAI-090]MDH6571991.1 serine phosphatase RsbU (regulator of sigma subunit) [Streptomyces sp. SAI-117]MDH6615221.1 serine phosphatase RsbU (regulator of sigma subunit) [Streptomyces sp. SAI-135]